MPFFVLVGLYPGIQAGGRLLTTIATAVFVITLANLQARTRNFVDSPRFQHARARQVAGGVDDAVVVMGWLRLPELINLPAADRGEAWTSSTPRLRAADPSTSISKAGPSDYGVRSGAVTGRPFGRRSGPPLPSRLSYYVRAS